MEALIHCQPIIWTVRLYPDGGGYPGPFIGVATVQAIGFTSIYVSAMQGIVTRKHLAVMADYFLSLGFKFVLMQRHGKIVQKRIDRFSNKKKP